MHMRIARYRPAPGAVPEEIGERVRQGLLPVFHRQPGFRGYWGAIGNDGSAVGISVFEDKAALEAALKHTRAWTADVLHDLLPDPPEVITCEVRVNEPGAMAAPAAWRQACCCVLTEREGAGATAKAVPLFQQHILPALRQQAGFLGHLGARDEAGEARLVSVQLWEDEAAAERGTAAIRPLIAEHMHGLLPPPRRETLCRVLASAAA